MKTRMGIVGFGIVGKSVLRFLSRHGFRGRFPSDIDITIFDSRSLSCEESDLIEKYKAKHVADIELERFISEQDFIVPSPGVDMRPYESTSRDKFVVELDLFSEVTRDFSIAITGSLGKTTVTGLIGSLISDTSVCGNIGYPMLDVDGNAILELSSFQLEYSNTFKPKIAVLTNLYPNHLNRHDGMEKYIDAKWNLFITQDETCNSILPLEILEGEYAREFSTRCSQLDSKVCFVSKNRPNADLLDHELIQNKKIFFIDGEQLYFALIKNGEICDEQLICSMKHFAHTTFVDNWLLAIVAAFLHGIEIETIISRSRPENLCLITEHRLEHFATIDGVDYYNDSKATVIEATMAAVHKLSEKGRPIILILGGLSKGADRSPLTSFVQGNPSIKTVFAFGPECDDFQNFGIKTFSTLEEVINAVKKLALPGDQVLFSPSGASFDLFKNYMHRGDEFKSLLALLFSKT